MPFNGRETSARIQRCVFLFVGTCTTEFINSYFESTENNTVCKDGVRWGGRWLFSLLAMNRLNNTPAHKSICVAM